ncbi:uncharacterized protein EV420DRAFT_963514 [Desarmillaria tabescens]|uniref:Uncharacterized protein n=1 Tax=Armillaria tabescens TaxID=1929756 RepID=A0AA39NH34_ARMTA|nr:uncharacterized protein EV420DRAFT_963514 [Desarmillaria tabescens]KAK0465513.1 hypothetical protein EV420DRAFT_963514 [Desarmillaria tabescens]
MIDYLLLSFLFIPFRTCPSEFPPRLFSTTDADYYSVCQPYPLNFDWDIHEDVLKHVRWIAACVGTRPFYAFHYKPKAPSMVIVEIEKNNAKGKASFLGEHRWKEFLLAPTPEERERVTRVFPCFHTNNRSVVKDGWHRVAVEDDWFKGWSAVQDFMQPYPATHHCVPPNEDRTNKSLCRPLPALYKPPPPPPTKPVVGSTSWVNAKTGTGPSTAVPLLGAWGRGRGGKNISIRNGGTNQTALPSRWNQPIVQNNKVVSPPAWGNNRGDQMPGGHSSSSKSLVGISKGSALSRPPGLPANPSGSFPAPPGITRAGNSGSGTSVTQEGSLDKQVARISLGEDHEADPYTLGDGLDEEDPVVAMSIPRYEVIEPAVSPVDDASGENLWSVADDTSTVSAPLCPLHGRPNCKPGICQAASKQKKQEQAEQRRREAEQARASGRGAGRGHGRGGRGGRGRGGSANSSRLASPVPERDPWDA